MNWLEGITIDILPEQYREMAEIIGVENTVKLAERYNKQPFYFVGLDVVMSTVKKQFIVKRFNGSNHRELARATNYSLQYVYEILRDHETARRTQPGLFDEK